MSTKKLIHFDLRTIEEHTDCTPWMLSTPYSVKLLSSPLWTEAFRNTRNCSKPWSTRKGHSFPQRFSGLQKSTPFPHGTEHTQAVRIKAVPQNEFKACAYILKISEFQIVQEKSHTHTHTYTKFWYAVDYLVNKFLNFHLLNYKVEQMRSHWIPGQPVALHEFPQSEWEVFFQGSLCIPKQMINSMSVK
jgi:hypothetical protein